MNPSTGEIRRFTSVEEARRAGFTVSLTDQEAYELALKSEIERMEWLQNRIRHPAVQQLQPSVEKPEPHKRGSTVFAGVNSSRRFKRRARA